MKIKYIGYHDSMSVDMRGKRILFPKNIAIEVPEDIANILLKRKDFEKVENVNVLKDDIKFNKKEEKLNENKKEE